LEPRFAGSNPAEDDKCLMAIKIRNTYSFGGEISSYSHVVKFYGILENPTGMKRDIS
jgi:hypothetical protein